jgi:dephospho-CoA kinase
MLTYGLTGGIGTGKSTVAEMFRERGIPVFDADDLGRQLLATENLAAQVLERFPNCGDAQGRVDRQKLAEEVFSREESRRALEDLLHPAILDEFEKQKSRVARPQPAYCLIEGAVLIESRTDFSLAGMIVVTAPVQTRLERLKKRDGADENNLRRRMEAQMPQHEKILAATHLIDNGDGLEETRSQVATLAARLAAENGEVV